MTRPPTAARRAAFATCAAALAQVVALAAVLAQSAGSDEVLTGRLELEHIFGPDAASLYHGFKKHFAHVKVIPSYENGVSVLGSQRPLVFDRSDEAFGDATLAGALRQIGIADRAKVEKLLARGDEIQARLEAEPPAFINSDLDPALEFRRSPQVRLLYSNF